jgi:hypothetical protein
MMIPGTVGLLPICAKLLHMVIPAKASLRERSALEGGAERPWRSLS